MSKISVYNYGKYSVFDIEEHLKKKGYKTELSTGNHKDELNILDTKISIDLPYYTSRKNGEKSVSPLPSIRFRDFEYKKSVWGKKGKELKEIINNKKAYEEDKKLYLHLQRKFRIGKVKNYPETIKEWEKINPLLTPIKKPIVFCFKFAIISTILLLIIAIPQMKKFPSPALIIILFYILGFLGVGLQLIKDKLR